MNSLSGEPWEYGERYQENQNFSNYQKEICYKRALSVRRL